MMKKYFFIFQIDFWKMPDPFDLFADMHLSASGYAEVASLLERKGIKYRVQINHIDRVIKL